MQTVVHQKSAASGAAEAEHPSFAQVFLTKSKGHGRVLHNRLRALTGALIASLAMALLVVPPTPSSQAYADPPGWNFGPNASPQCNNPDAPASCPAQWTKYEYPEAWVSKIADLSKGQCQPYDATHVICRPGYRPPPPPRGGLLGLTPARGRLLSRGWADWLDEFKAEFEAKQRALLATSKYSQQKKLWQRTNPWVMLNLNVYPTQIVVAPNPSYSNSGYANFVINAVLPAMTIPDFPVAGVSFEPLTWQVSISSPGKPQFPN
jgi:hypothetical protein